MGHGQPELISAPIAALQQDAPLILMANVNNVHFLALHPLQSAEENSPMADELHQRYVDSGDPLLASMLEAKLVSSDELKSFSQPEQDEFNRVASSPPPVANDRLLSLASALLTWSPFNSSNATIAKAMDNATSQPGKNTENDFDKLADLLNLRDCVRLLNWEEEELRKGIRESA